MTFSSVVTLANSIIGVSILAMPYCFKQCGIVLATLMIIMSGTVVKLSCHLLLKAAIMARRRNFEYLAFHTYGHTGKLLVELGIIGFLAGTAIAFFVVMGDLGPPLIANLAQVEATANLRLVILTGLGLFVALPLSLLRNIESLQYICTTSIIFYLVVVFRVIIEATPQLRSGDWVNQVNLWRPAGMLQCFPIFSMALACQTNLFEVYSSLQDGTPQKMTDVVKGAVNLCSGLYITIGFFGYIAFCNVDFGGNILTSFTTESTFIDFLKLGFVISVAVSFPLVIFPCRTSIHSLIFRKTYQGIGSTELVTDYIPPARFNMITLTVISFALIFGIMIPDIEIVLGMVGSTMGSSICVIFPAAAFLKLTSKNTTERLAAQGVLVVGVITLILGTYVNLVEHTAQDPALPPGQPGPAFVKPMYAQQPHQGAADKIEKDAKEVLKNISSNLNSKEKSVVADKPAEKSDKEKKQEVKGKESVVSEETRQEPAIPQEPPEENAAKPDPTVIRDKKADPDSTLDEVEQKSEEKNADQPKKEKETNPAESKETGKKEKIASQILEEMAKQKVEQDQILKEQKEILSQLKEHQKQEVANVQTVGQESAVQDLQSGGAQQQHQVGPVPVQQQAGAIPAQQQAGVLPVQQQQGAGVLPIQQQQQAVALSVQQQQLQAGALPVQQQKVEVLPVQQQAGVMPVQQQAGGIPMEQQAVVMPVQQQQQVGALPVQQQQQPGALPVQQVGALPVQQQQQLGALPVQQQQQLGALPVQPQPGALPVQQQQGASPVQQQPGVLPVQQQQQLGVLPVQQQQQVGAMPIQQQQELGAFPVQQQLGALPVQQLQLQAGALPVQQQQQVGVLPVQQQQQVGVLSVQQQRQAGALPVQQQHQAGVSPVHQQQVGAMLVQQQAGALPVQQQAGALPVQQQAGALPVQQQAGALPVQQQAGALPVQQQAGALPVQQKSGAMPIQQQQQQSSVVSGQAAPNQPSYQVVPNQQQQQYAINQKQQVGAPQPNKLYESNPPMVVVKPNSNVNNVQSNNNGKYENQFKDVDVDSIKRPPQVNSVEAGVNGVLDAAAAGFNRELPDANRLPVEFPNAHLKSPGRDLKQSERVRREICLNDPNCEEKFDRNPLSDSFLDQDLTELLKVGKRSLLTEPRTHFSTKKKEGNYSNY